ncbi:MAG TPA: AraC family transcriptional regulator [Flavisolibacter sp.]|jgi:AraC family transcriptional regulator|nr:AraC family transcriptional regulator [Flavisolibacter sp.]
MKLTCGKYFGNTLETISVQGLVLTEKVHAAGESLPEHFHENAYFCMALNGGWNEMVEGKIFSCQVDHVVYHPQEEVHQTFFHPDQLSRTFNVEMTPEWIHRMSAYGIEPVKNRILSKDRSLTPLLQKLYREFHHRDTFSRLAIESLFSELMVYLSRTGYERGNERQTLWLHELKQLLETTYANPLSLTELSQLFSVHPVHLSKCFKEQFGMTVTAYYRKCRVEAACRLLKDTSFSLVAVALECGFYDQSHFCKHFHALTGLSPRAYRKQYKQ